MQPFNTVKGIAAPLPILNIDTDMIIPKQFLKTIKRTGLGQFLFFEMRFDMQGNENPKFILNQDHYRNASILIGGENFGCGSSREHAPWAIVDFGITCVIAPSFADIFYNNCFKNGILPIALPQEDVDRLMKFAEVGAHSEMTIDLPQQKILAANGAVISFEIEPFRKQCLLNGWDDIGLTLKHEAEITAYEKARAKLTPWLFAA